MKDKEDRNKTWEGRYKYNLKGNEIQKENLIKLAEAQTTTVHQLHNLD
jgi:hypothetical protein